MFEDRLETGLGNPRALLNLAADTMHAERAAGCRKLQIAAAWADCHSAPAGLELVDGEPVQDLCEERFVRLGGAATPLVAEFAPTELGHTLQTSLGSAGRLLACALTIRHRLPRLWDRVKAGEVWAWKAMQYADKTRHLGGLSSWLVDMKITQYVESMSWPRFLDLLDATLLEVDEATYQQRAEEAANHKDVRSYRGEHGLRTLIAKMEAGDALAFEALVNRVAECLADEGDDDPVGARRAKAVGIIAHQARLRDLLARHADQPHDPRHPEDRANAHLDDPTDPWAEDDIPQAGWETSRHSNYHQPSFDDLDDLQDCWNTQTEPAPDEAGPQNPGPEEAAPEDDATTAGGDALVGEDDQAWLDQQRDTEQRDAEQQDPDQPAEEPTESTGEVSQGKAVRVGRAFRAEPAERGGRDSLPPTHATPTERTPEHGACHACGSTFDLRPFTTKDLAACATKAVLHLHVTDQTLINQRGVLRTADGPITLEQFRRWLTDSDANITIRPVLDPTTVAPVDSYEIPAALREAVHTQHPGSVYPFSPATEITIGGRLDLDHTIAYRKNGPPDQTRIGNLGPLTRTEHRAKTLTNWQVRQPEPGTHLWRSPHGWISVVTNQGTLLLGDSAWAHRVWKTVAAAPQIESAG